MNNVEDIPWGHVSSEENPADLATRGMAPGELLDNELWWYGPPWLRSTRMPYPSLKRSFVNEADLESKPVRSFHTVVNKHEDILKRFSSLPKALRIISYIYRFYNRLSKRCKDKPTYKTIDVTRDEIIFVKERLIILSQRTYFPSEFYNLESNQLIRRSSQLLTLNPVLDTKGIMRVNGRLANSSLSWAERYPIILPYNSLFTKLLVDFIHSISLHGGNQLMLVLIRQEYWIPKLKNLIKARINQCKICVIHKKHQRSQLMAALPLERSDFSPPFSKIGIDFAGPFDIKTYFGRSCRITKGYVCVFVCFCTKAIHLEGTTELSTASFLAAFYRFVGRRGLPSDIYSDNGTNFVGANRTLRKDFKACLKESSSQFCKHYNNEPFWHFIPPGAPHMGGLWEAGVKSFKAHFKKVADGYKYTFEEFTTLLCRIESCLNSRPISALSENPSNNLSLTPVHFLIGRPLLSVAEPNLQNSSISLVNRWEKLQVLHHNFCKRWKEEYLKELHKRYKWKFPQRDIAIGDVVVVKKENLTPTEWRLGRVTNVFPGNDGRVRVAKIRTQQGEICRPIVKLCVIPTE